MSADRDQIEGLADDVARLIQKVDLGSTADAAEVTRRVRSLDRGLPAENDSASFALGLDNADSVYPPDGALIEWRGKEVPLEVIGGKAPFRLLVDGKPLPPAPPRQPIYWQPDGIGFALLAVIDAAGRSARSTVRLSP